MKRAILTTALLLTLPANYREWEAAYRSFGSDPRKRRAIDSCFAGLDEAQRRCIDRQLRANALRRDRAR